MRSAAADRIAGRMIRRRTGVTALLLAAGTLSIGTGALLFTLLARRYPGFETLHAGSEPRGSE